jgi:transmembrane 9 superfamily protein 1
MFGSWKALSHAKESPYKPPCKTRRVAREIPPGHILTSWPFILIVSAVLPFSSIYIEVHYIFNSVWGPRIYTLFGMLAISFCMLLMVTASTVVGVIYFKLTEEDWKWPWRAFISSSSTGWVLYLYAWYFFNSHSDMDGHLQTIFYFSYTWLISWAVSLTLGTVGFFAANVFVTRVYAFIKSD